MRLLTILRNIRLNFFGKIMITYVAITTAIMFSLVFIVTQNISSMLTENYKNFNKQILLRVNSYFENKFDLAKNIVKAMYTENNSTWQIPDMLKGIPNTGSQEYPSARSAYDSFLRAQLTRDKEISALIIYRNIDSSRFIYPRSSNATITDSNSDISSKISQHTFGPMIEPSHIQEYITGIEPKEYIYSFLQNLKDPVNYTDIGVLSVDFKSKDVRNSYKEYESDIQGYILVLDSMGNVIFDSSQRYYNSKYPYFDIIAKSPKEADLDEKSIVNVYQSSIPGVLIAGIIPEIEINKNIIKLKTTIYLISFLLLFLALLLSYISMVVFSKRVKTIISAMKKVRKGDLTIRVPIQKKNDEINEIAVSFNKMCEDLKDHINKVYVSGLKQKSAELNALQSQINPHFLYNTLESIRLRAITKGDEDTGEMMYILGSLFRNLIKEELIISIEDEIRYCEMYLQLFMIRYEEKLAVKFNISPEVLEYGIIKHLIQPIIENYFMHGIRPERDDNNLCIRAYSQGESIEFEFEDNGFGIDPIRLEEVKNQMSAFTTSTTSSIGLGNVNERVKIFYGHQYGINIESIEGIGTTIRLLIPKKTKLQLKSEMAKYV